MSRQHDNYRHRPASRASGRHRSRSYSPGYWREQGRHANTTNHNQHRYYNDISQRHQDNTNNRDLHDYYNDNSHSHRDNSVNRSSHGYYNDNSERGHSHHNNSVNRSSHGYYNDNSERGNYSSHHLNHDNEQWHERRYVLLILITFKFLINDLTLYFRFSL